MNIKRAKEEIKDTIESYLLKDEWGEYVITSIRQRPVLLIGPPGVGKTQIMEQISRECKIGLVAYTITHHTRQSAVGLPFIEKKQYGGREYTVTEYTMSEIVASIYEKIEQTGLKEGILFIDEINCVSETLAPTMLQFLQCKTFGSHKIPEGWVITAAGNPPEYNKSVREFDVVTLDRIKKILIEPDLGVWKEYAYEQNIHSAILSYLGVKPQNFCQIETTVDGKRFATPRGWEDLSQLIQVYEQLGKRTDREVIGQYIQHPKIAKDFANYLELYYKYQNDYQVEEILNGVIKEALCDRVARASFDERLSVTGLLLSKLTQGFKELWLKNQEMELLMGQLKEFQKRILENGTEEAAYTGNSQMQPYEVMASLAGELEALRKKGQENGLISRVQAHLYRCVSGVMEGYARELALLIDTGLVGDCMPADPLPNEEAKKAWQWVREQFMRESDSYEEKKEDCGRKLEHAFDFMEASFGSGQEMVIFVTELNASEACLRFLNEYECPRYYQYNKELLFDEQERGIHQNLG